MQTLIEQNALWFKKRNSLYQNYLKGYNINFMNIYQKKKKNYLFIYSYCTYLPAIFKLPNSVYICIFCLLSVAIYFQRLGQADTILQSQWWWGRLFKDQTHLNSNSLEQGLERFIKFYPEFICVQSYYSLATIIK